MRVVLDTNVLISGIFFTGPPSTILTAWIDDAFELAVSTAILEEYRAVTDRIGGRFPGVQIGPVLDRISLHALLVIPAKLPAPCAAPLLRQPGSRGRDASPIRRAARGALTAIKD
jgi:hypothetical protein